MVVVDATVLLLFLRPDAGRPLDAEGRPIDRAAERVDYLVNELSANRSTIIIPAPALAEVLVGTDAKNAAAIVNEINKHAVFRIEPFDALAAIELAAMNRDTLKREVRRNTAATWAKLKFDQQIVAIAKVKDVTMIYSDDGDVRAIARRANISVQGIAELPLPPESAQFGIEFPPPSDAG